ncbi:MAG: hypothetical protein NC177_04800 [Ruminococcus flavefaciens]|nr:hypothetical protein [Ruminococcus flavefaciens]
MKKFILLILCFMAFTLTGCSKDMNKEDVIKYLENRYHKEFTFVSNEKYPCEKHNHLNEKSDTENKVDVEVYADENGLEFHVYHFVRGMVMGTRCIADDYCVQELISQPELYEPLEDFEFDFKYFYDISSYGERYAGFYVNVPEYEDIRPVAERAFSVVQNDKAVLSDCGIIGDDFDTSVIPAIYLVDKDGEELGKLKFRTEQIPQVTDKEDFIYIAEKRFSGWEVYKNIGKISVYSDDRQVAFLEKGTYNRGYTIQDTVPLHEEMEFKQLRTLCELSGYTFNPNGDKLRIEKGDDKITIIRTKGNGYDYSIFSVYKNGELFIPEGEIDEYLSEDLCSLTIADYYYLFGIKITVDYENGKAIIETD